MLLVRSRLHYIYMNDRRIDELIEQQFPSLENMLYANHAAISPWPVVTTDAVVSFARENADSGSLHYAQWLLRESRLRERIAKMLNASGGDDIALLKNTTEGICTVANGIDWREGDNLVTPESEFLSNQLAWEALSIHGVEIRKVQIFNTDDPESALLNAMDDRTRVLSISSVQWDSGLRLNLKKLGQACKGSNALFFVDAIQQFGALRIDVTACHIDALAAGAHKWQMGPEGIALFYCAEELRQRLKLSQLGWRMMDAPYRFERSAHEASSSARRYETGTPNTMGQAALYASLGLLCDVGLENVEQKVLENTGKLISLLGDRAAINFQSPVELSRRSGIVSFTVDGINPDELKRALAKLKVYVAVRGSALRLSPHFYQAGRRLDPLLNALNDCL